MSVRYGANLPLGYLIKRLVLGRPLATSRLEHERLGRPTALAVFSSDNMSSVAYATEEILRVLIPAVGVTAFALVVPVSVAIVLIEAILIFSYRQTIKAYPSAGGAYIVTKDNLGLLPAQVAGVALLVDYVLTVAVSTAAGVQAISSVVPLTVAVRILLSLLFVWIIAYGNLLGVRESGRIFAIPTYLFITSLYLTCAMGIYGILWGHLGYLQATASQPQGGLPLGTGPVVLFVVLKAFASGGAAVTGVEAISNGVPAFRKPEWRNAQKTLMYMGAILGGSFLAVSFLAHRLHVVPVADESKSVLSQIGQAVYGSGGAGHLLYLVLQASTTLILILAANTSFADFPRLASFHAGDAFMPRQLTRRGHRLVFSNGIIALAGAASLVLIVFRASVTAMIPLYALGVFASFTLSQGGMARRHLRLREPGWRMGLLVNGTGAIATLLVALVIGIVKFAGGAWLVMLGVPILVFLLVRINHTYGREEEDLLGDLRGMAATKAGRHVAVVLVDGADNRSMVAVRYAFTIEPEEVRAVLLSSTNDSLGPKLEGWKMAGPDLPLQVIPCDEQRGACLANYLASKFDEEVSVTVVMAAPAQLSPWWRPWGGRTLSSVSLSSMPNVTVAIVHPGNARESLPRGRLRVVPRPRHVAILLAGRLDRSVIKALRYVRSVNAIETRVMHAAADPDHAAHLLDQWAELGFLLQARLDVVRCPDRNVTRAVRDYVREVEADDTEITIVIPRRDYHGRLQGLLHDRTSRSLARVLQSAPHVNVVIVPYRVNDRLPKRDQGAPGSVQTSGSGPRLWHPKRADRVPAR